MSGQVLRIEPFRPELLGSPDDEGIPELDLPIQVQLSRPVENRRGGQLKIKEGHVLREPVPCILFGEALAGKLPGRGDELAGDLP